MWPLQTSRYLALVFAIVLAVVEALLNMSRPHWQYAPLWIIDYVIVAALLAGVWLTRTRSREHVPVLIAGWALAAGVFYMALFIALDPEMTWPEGPPPASLLGLIGLGVVVQVVGLLLAMVAHYRAGPGASPPAASRDAS